MKTSCISLLIICVLSVFSLKAQNQNFGNDISTKNSVIIASSENINKNSFSTTVDPDRHITKADPLIITGTSTNNKCFGGTTGAIDITVSGGTLPYDYLWTNLSTDEDLTSLSAGTYTVTVTDNDGTEATHTIVINQPGKISITLDGTNPICHNGLNGSLDMTVSGGTPTYTFLWNDPSSSTSEDIGNLSPAKYKVTVTDANNCSTIDSITLANPAKITLTLAGTNPTCYNGTDGNIDLTVTGGGTPAYKFLWNDPSSSTSEDIGNLSPAKYKVTVTDDNNCSTIDSITLANPAKITLTLSGSSPTCNNGTNGNIDLTVTGGGTPTFTFLWNDPSSSTSEDIGNLSSGKYKVTITDANSCKTLDSITITNPPLIVLSFSGYTPSCSPGGDGSIDLTVTGGIKPFTYQWDDPLSSTIQDINTLVSGTYHVTVTDSLGCIKTSFYELSNSPNPAISNSIIESPSCIPGLDGFIDITITSGASPYTFQWNNPANSTTEDISGLNTGFYSVTVTDLKECTITALYQVPNPPSIILILTGDLPSCTPGGDGGVDLTINGGASPFTYLWNDPLASTTEDISGLIAGKYIVTVTDNKKCTTSDTIDLINATAPVLSFSVTNPTCYMGSDGKINLIISGGTSPFSYKWNDASNSTIEDISSLPADTFIVSVTDAKQCKTTDTTKLLNPLKIVITHLYVDPKCTGSYDGSIDIDVFNGTPPFSYQWNDMSYSTTQDISNLKARKYKVIVTDVNGCTGIDSVTLKDPAPITTFFIANYPSCSPGSDGSINLSVAGGFPPYTYLWDDASNSTTEDMSILDAKVYHITITDSKNCIKLDSLNLHTSYPPSLIFDQIINPSCTGYSDGLINLRVMGGSPPVNYLWNDPSNSTSEDLQSLPADTFIVVVTDKKNCSSTDTAILIDPPPLNVASNITVPTCVGYKDGSIDLTITGGTPSYSFLWDDISATTTEDIGGLAKDTLNILVSDSKGCQKKQTITILDPPAIVLILLPSGADCHGNDGSIDLKITGGATPPYSFIWSNGSTSEDLVNLSSGIYKVTLTDVKGCVQTDSSSVIDLGNMSLILNSNPTTCTGTDGSIDLIVIGGTPPFSYKWTNGATTQDISNLNTGKYIVTVTDFNKCTIIDSLTIQKGYDISITLSLTDPKCFGNTNGSISANGHNGTLPYSYKWSTGATNQTISNLAPGKYFVTITDTKSCSMTDSATLTEPQKVNLVLIPSKTSCSGYNNGSINLIVNGGIFPYHYLWNDPSSSTTEDLSALTAGTYIVTVTDYNNCSAVDSVKVLQPDTLSVTINSTKIVCYNINSGSIDLTVQGGTYPYFYSWNTGDINPDLQNLFGGSYHFTITDANGCIYKDNVIIAENSKINSTPSWNDVFCYGLSNASINMTVSGGILPYTYTWYNSKGITSYDKEDLEKIPAETYRVKITDSLNCFSWDTITITQPEKITIYGTIRDVACTNDSTGIIDLTVYGGIPAYKYKWSHGATVDSVTQLPKDIYIVTVSDNNSCTATKSFSINEPEKNITMKSIIIQNISCRDKENASIEISVEEGTTPYMIEWSNGSSDYSIDSLNSGIYKVTITDANYCTLISSFTIMASKESCIEIHNAFSPNADGKNDEWTIDNIELYPDCKVIVFNQWGVKVFESIGYSVPWNGITDDGSILPAATYYYIIDLGNGYAPYTGSLSIVK